MSHFNKFYYVFALLFTYFNAHAAYNVQLDEINIVEEFSTSNFSLRTDNTYTPLATWHGKTFFVWVGSDFRPRVAKIENGSVDEYFLDNGTDYTVRNDGHHMFSMGIDAKGYIHITGDMHHHPASNTDHLPDRLKNSKILYWVSKNPGDVSEFVFTGNSETSVIPGYGFTYHSFHTDPEGNLFFLARQRVHAKGHHSGEMGLSMARYNAETKIWTALGALPPSDREAEDPCIVWEDNGYNGGWYQAFRSDIRFDPSGRLHLASTVNNNNDQDGPTHVIYAYSDDKGDTWHKADGTSLELPLRVDPGPGQADLLAENLQLDMMATVFFDQHGNPAVTYQRKTDTGGHQDMVHRWWNPTSKSWSAEIFSPVGGWIRNQHHLDANGIITMTGADASGKILRQSNFEDSGKKFNTGRYLYSWDQLGMKTEGVIRAVSFNSDKTIQSIVRIEFSNPATPTPVLIEGANQTSLGLSLNLGERTSGENLTLRIENQGDAFLRIDGSQTDNNWLAISQPILLRPQESFQLNPFEIPTPGAFQQNITLNGSESDLNWTLSGMSIGPVSLFAVQQLNQTLPSNKKSFDLLGRPGNPNQKFIPKVFRK